MLYKGKRRKCILTIIRPTVNNWRASVHFRMLPTIFINGHSKLACFTFCRDGFAAENYNTNERGDKDFEAM